MGVDQIRMTVKTGLMETIRDGRETRRERTGRRGGEEGKRSPTVLLRQASDLSALPALLPTSDSNMPQPSFPRRAHCHLRTAVHCAAPLLSHILLGVGAWPRSHPVIHPKNFYMLSDNLTPGCSDASLDARDDRETTTDISRSRLGRARARVATCVATAATNPRCSGRGGDAGC